MISSVSAEELQPRMKVHLLGHVWVAHAPPYFWPLDAQGKGFIVVRDEAKQTAGTITIYRGEKIAIE